MTLSDFANLLAIGGFIYWLANRKKEGGCGCGGATAAASSPAAEPSPPAEASRGATAPAGTTSYEAMLGSSARGCDA